MSYASPSSHKNRAKEVARLTVAGKHDVLLACREIADLKDQLTDVPSEIMDTFIGVASEIDGLPVGEERKHWSAEALMKKDEQLNNYRNRVKKIVETEMWNLMSF